MKKVKKQIIKSIDKATSSEKLGSVFFGVGLLIAFIMAIVVAVSNVSSTATQIVTVTLVILGLIIGFLNITNQEAVAFLISTVVLVLLTGPFLGNIVQTFALGSNGVQFLGELFKNIIGLVVPAAILVSLRTLFNVAKDEN